MAADTDPIDDQLGTEEFERLYVLYAPSIFRYAVRRLGPTLAEDICSQTFVIAWEQLPQFEAERGNPGAWLFGIATNLIRRHHRAEARQMRAYARTGEEPMTTDATLNVVARVDAQAQWPLVASVLVNLRQDERDLLWLQATSGLSYPEIADVIGIPVGTVRSRLSRLRAKIELSFGTVPEAGDRGTLAGER